MIILLLKNLKKQGTPSVSYFAEEQHPSSNYFGDLIKKEPGKSAHEHIQTKLIEVAKKKSLIMINHLVRLLMNLGLSILSILPGYSKIKLGIRIMNTGCWAK